MAKDGTWGDHVVLFAAANHFQTPIRIISSLNYETVVHPDHAVANTSPLVLGHIHEFHYVSLHPSQGKVLNSLEWFFVQLLEHNHRWYKSQVYLKESLYPNHLRKTPFS